MLPRGQLTLGAANKFTVHNSKSHTKTPIPLSRFKMQNGHVTVSPLSPPPNKRKVDVSPERVA
jgi:hypothetical protein